MQVYKGNIIFTPKINQLETLLGGYIVVNDAGQIIGVYPILPEKYHPIPLVDFGDKLLIPAFSDLHLHSAQLPIAGLGYDEGGNSWFEKYATPIEKQYEEIDYAKQVNKELVHKLWQNGVLHSNIMSSCCKQATRDLMMQLDEANLVAYVGKMNADYPAFAPAPETTADSIAQTQELIEWAQTLRKNVKYALCPEFLPTISEELLAYLGAVSEQYNLPVHSHMSEADFDTECVAKRFPQHKNYGTTLNAYGLFGQRPTVMAHCLHCDEDELEKMAKNKVFAAHCPTSNFHTPSGRYFPARRFLEEGIPVAICSDFGGGHTLNQMQVMVSAIHTSKLFMNEAPLTSTEAFYLVTKSPGAFFGRTGSFEQGYWFDALVIDDRELNRFMNYTLAERLQRFIYCGSHYTIERRYLQGKLLG